jgi:RNA polymerase sigma-70 factor, ECF subfamily
VAKPAITISNPLEDVQLVELAKDNPEKFKPLYEKYFKRIFLFVHHRINDRAISADITSQVFLKALINLSKYKSQGVPFSAWLFRIALNECNDFFRRSNRYRFVSIDDHEGVLNGLHEELLADTSIDNLQMNLPGILEQLSEDELYLLELRFFERRAFKEVADIMGTTESNAKVKVYRLLDKMKRLFITSSSR